MKKTISLVLVLALCMVSEVADADFTFGEPLNLGPTVNSSWGDTVSCFSADGLEMYFDSLRPGGHGAWDTWVTRRPTRDDYWGTPSNLGPQVNTGKNDGCASISADGLELYFDSYNRPGGHGHFDIWVTRRTNRDKAWGAPVNLGPTVNGSTSDAGAWLSADDMELYFISTRTGGFGSYDIWVTNRATRNDPWGEAVNLGQTVNSSADECYPSMSTDSLLLLFSDDQGAPIRPGGFGNMDIWATKRARVSEPWGTPVNLGPMVNGPSLDGQPRISPDGFTLYFSSARPGGWGGAWGDIYQVPIIPIVDLNGDGIVDSTDMCIVVDHWGEDYSSCDIGPMPWGDGVVDVNDLVVLSEHLFEDVNDPTLVAHWPLDDAQGVIAYDSAADCDGTLIGGPIWQPDGGILDGALQFDGIDDYVGTPFVLNPADGKFSVFTWIKGNTPGQVVISQANGANWFLGDPSEGKLMTSLSRPPGGRTPPPPLVSEFVVTDGVWHRIGFVWDGVYRALYVDGVEVAKDAAPLSGLEGAFGGLYIGFGSDSAAGTLWSGLIDDVRIYNRAVRP